MGIKQNAFSSSGRKGCVLALTAAGLYGTAGVFGRLAAQYESDPLTIAMCQITIGAALLFFSLFIFSRDVLRIGTFRQLPLFAAYGFFGMFCAPVGFYYAITYTSVTTATILFCSYPAFVVLFSAIFLRQPLTRRTGAPLLLAIFGNALVAQCYDPHLLRLNLIGIAFGLATSLSMAFFTLLGKRMTGDYSPWTVIFYGMAFGALFLFAFRLPRGGLRWDYPWPFWTGILLLALLPALLADVCYLTSLRYSDAGTVSIIASFQVVVAPALAFLFLGERLAWPQLVGIAIVVSGIALLHACQTR